jgi:hypothetical protein
MVSPVDVISGNETLPLRHDLVFQRVALTVALPIVLNILKCYSIYVYPAQKA